MTNSAFVISRSIALSPLLVSATCVRLPFRETPHGPHARTYPQEPSQVRFCPRTLHAAPIRFNSIYSGLPGQNRYTRVAQFGASAPDRSLAGVRIRMLMQERWLSVGEIATHLGVNPDTIYKWVERKKLPAHKLGRLWKFLASEVDAWIKAGKAGVGSSAPAPKTKKARKASKKL